MRKIVDAYMTNHPEQLHKDSSIMVTAAISEAFPCK
jgi:hypothetical protein